MLKITRIKIWKVYFPLLTQHYNLKIAIMWIQKVSHSVLNLYKHCLFSCSRVLNVNGMVDSSRDMYLDAHVKPVLLTDVNKWFWVKSRKTTLFICPWFYKHQIRRSSRSAGEAATHNMKLTERGGRKEKQIYTLSFQKVQFTKVPFSIFFFLPVTSLGLGFELNSSPQKSAKGFCLFIQLPSGELNSIEQHFIHRADANKHSWSICSREVAVRSLSAEHACHSPGISEQKLTVRSIYLH